MADEKCPKCGSTMEWMPVDCDHQWHSRVKVGENFDVLKSFDARHWAAAFMAITQAHPEITVDYELMTTWFANALMRGFDEHRWRTTDYKRSIRRALHPWWSWRRYMEVRNG